MKKLDIDPKYINLKSTESASLSAKATLLSNINKLMEHGVSFSLDDFGIGQSNLNYIVDMRINIVKFDREMTQVKYVMDAVTI